MPSVECDRCGESFARQDNLTRHKNRKNRCDSTQSVDRTDQAAEKRKHIDGDSWKPSKRLKEDRILQESEQSETETIPKRIPTFDGNEFSGNKSLTRDTLYRMMEMLKVPEHRQDKIATEILKQDRNQKDPSKFIDESDEDEEGPLTEPELKELLDCFRTLHYDLLHKGRRENVPELLDMLDVLLETGEITRADYMKTTNKIKGYL